RFAPVVSAEIKWYPTPTGPFFLRLRGTEIAAIHDPDHLLVDLGAGWYFGAPDDTHRWKLPPLSDTLHGGVEPDRFQYTQLVGVSRVNTFIRSGADAVGGEFRWGLLPHLDGTLGYMYEGDTATVRRSGLTSQLWLMSSAIELHRAWKIGIGLGLGTYANFDTKRIAPAGHPTGVPFLAGLMSPSIYLDMPGHLCMRGIWNRVITDYNEDADVWLLGVGYRFR
ncbi:MAG: hypothetical protein ACREFX_04690, partial [Opitutaceae bacterium]